MVEHPKNSEKEKGYSDWAQPQSRRLELMLVLAFCNALPHPRDSSWPPGQPPGHVATSSLKTPWTAPCGMVTLSSAAPTFPSCNLPDGLVFPDLAAPAECELLRQEIRCLHNLCNSPPHTHTHGARHTVGAYHCLLTGTGSVMILIIGG